MGQLSLWCLGGQALLWELPVELSHRIEAAPEADSSVKCSGCRPREVHALASRLVLLFPCRWW